MSKKSITRTKTAPIQVYFSDAEKARILDAANASHETMSSLIRRVVAEWLERERKNPGKP